VSFVLLLLVGFLLETIRLSWLGRLPLGLDPVFGVVVIAGLVRKQPSGAFFGFVVGLLRDWLYGGPAGINTLIFTCIGAGMGSLGKTIYRDAPITHAVMIVLAFLARGVFEFVLVSGGSPSGLHWYVLRVVLPGAVLTAILVPGVYHLILNWNRRRKAIDLEAILEEAARREHDHADGAESP
jgi:rod shape-determining protein MreD